MVIGYKIGVEQTPYERAEVKDHCVTVGILDRTERHVRLVDLGKPNDSRIVVVEVDAVEVELHAVDGTPILAVLIEPTAEEEHCRPVVYRRFKGFPHSSVRPHVRLHTGYSRGWQRPEIG